MRLIRLLRSAVDNHDTRGTFGEMIVASIFDSRFFGTDERYIVNDLIFKLPDESTHQIDHVLIYKKGIFCIETKNISGVIMGSDDDYQWTVCLRGFDNYPIFNPIKQNKKHVIVLSEFLEYEYDVKSIVVFIHGNKPNVRCEQVLNLVELKDYVKNYPCEKELNSEEMKKVFELLANYKSESKVTKAEHIKNVRKKRK